MNICICPGSFDPVTNGHIDIFERAKKICDHLIVAVGENANKKTTFSVSERIDMLNKTVGCKPGISVESFDGLLIEFAKQKNAQAIVKGLRAISDFEYEFQMALLNKKLFNEIETLFIATSVNYSYLSSSVVKEIAKNGGSIDGLVPECIVEEVMNKCRQR